MRLLGPTAHRHPLSDDGAPGSRSRVTALVRWWPALVGVFFLLLFHRFWTHAVVFRDSFVLFAPQKFLLGQALRAGELRAWNPYQFLGLPLVGDILAGWFYPLNLLYSLLPLDPAHRLFILVHYPMAVIFMTLFLRGLKLSLPAALVGGLGFGLSGYLVSQHSNLPYLVGPALAPLALYFYLRSLDHWKHLVSAAAALAFQVLAGEPQSAGITGVIMLAIGAARSATERKARPAALALAAGALGLCLSAIQLCPALELLPAGARSQTLGLDEALFYSLHPASLAEFIWPNALGRLTPDLHYWGLFTIDRYGPHISYPWSATHYLGFPLLALAAYGLIAGRKRPAWFAGVCAGLFLALALGRHLPLYALLQERLPVFGLFRYPAKYGGWFSGAAAALAALGFEEFSRRAREDHGSLLRPALIAGGLLVAVLAFAAWAGPMAMENLGRLTPGSEDHAWAMHNLKLGAVQVAVAGGLALLVALLRARKILSPRPTILALLLILAADLAANVSTMNAGPADIFTGRSTAGLMVSPQSPTPGGPRVFRDSMNFPTRLIAHPSPRLAELPEIPRLCRWERETLKNNFGQLEGFEDIGGFNETRPMLGLYLLADPDEISLNLFGVAAVITRSGLDRSFLPWPREENEEYDFLVLRNPNPRPRAYLAAGAVAVADDAEAERMIYESGLGGRVTITASGPVEPAPLPALVPARIESYRSDEVTVTATAPGPAWLVLSDRYFPGWRVYVDGEEKKIERANLLIRAVLVGPGEHRVRFVYRPWPLRIGLWVTLAAVLAAAVFVITGPASKIVTTWERD